MLNAFKEVAIKTFGEAFELSEVEKDCYSKMKYPKLIPFMKFDVQRFYVKGFGHIMFMKTNAPGSMELMTASFMPNEGLSVPYLLIDMMSLKNKRTVFVEYYDCTKFGVNFIQGKLLNEKYKDLQNYQEKEAWYIKERTDYSLIKFGNSTEENILTNMVAESISDYVLFSRMAKKDEDNLVKLKEFRDRMILEGNPSSGVMSKVLGDKGSKEFFTKVVMPL